MSFIADLHIHSRFSRATSRSLTLVELARWGAIKGISLIGTGDCTHPQWLSEIKASLTYQGDGLFRLNDELVSHDLPCSIGNVRFMLTGEISTIYKAGGVTRKVHHVVCLPDLASAERFNTALARIGNIASDGRPIIGLDSRDLLEMLLTASPRAVLIPAHIWTPWFSVLGSKSGFDSIEECYRDLSPHIFALETGLSSDPAMNWMVSRLDRYTLVSNSDLHSAGKLGREANIFSCEMHYDAVMAALKEPSKGFDGTLEFFPQEGKYHYDGHRVCGVCLDPTESRKLNGICPACGKPLTLGVMYRVLELADRPFGVKKPHALPFRSLIGLDDILAELLQCGVASKKVQNEYRRLIGLFGPELPMLLDAPLDDLARRASPRLSEAVGRVREGRVNAVSGYDGEFGTISVFP
jgi:DNA helicase-2/ATP-dependent DNA helicase PcrA